MDQELSEVRRFIFGAEPVCRDKFVEHGWDGCRFRELPHFQSAHDLETAPGENAPLLYCGRLSPEKGVDDLLRAMSTFPSSIW